MLIVLTPVCKGKGMEDRAVVPLHEANGSVVFAS